MMHEYLVAFFHALNERLPPPAGMKHAMTMCHYGSDKDGWEEKLSVALAVDGGHYQTLFIEIGDLEKPADFLAAECIAVYADIRKLEEE